MRIGSLVFALFLAIPLASQTKHPFTFEDMMALKRVQEPVPSPDGKWVLFTAVDVDLKANTKTPHVWVVPLSQATAGSRSTPSQESVAQGRLSTSVGMTVSKEREIISDQDADRPRWAPDGKRFAFISNKEGGSQIWIAILMVLLALCPRRTDSRLLRQGPAANCGRRMGRTFFLLRMFIPSATARPLRRPTAM